MEDLQEFLTAIKQVGGLEQVDKGKASDGMLGAISNIGKISQAMMGKGGGNSMPNRPPMAPPMAMPPMPPPRPNVPPPGAGPTPPMMPPMPPGMVGPQGPGAGSGAMQKIGTSPQAMAYLKSLVPGLGGGGGMMPGM